MICEINDGLFGCIEFLFQRTQAVFLRVNTGRNQNSLARGLTCGALAKNRWLDFTLVAFVSLYVYQNRQNVCLRESKSYIVNNSIKPGFKENRFIDKDTVL